MEKDVKTPEQEHRRFERYRSQTSVWIRPLHETREHDLLETLNISAGGLLFDLDYPMEANDILDIRFELPQCPHLIRATSRVVRVEKTETNYRIAVSFNEVQNLDVNTLLAYLEAVFD